MVGWAPTSHQELHMELMGTSQQAGKVDLIMSILSVWKLSLGDATANGHATSVQTHAGPGYLFPTPMPHL